MKMFAVLLLACALLTGCEKKVVCRDGHCGQPVHRHSR